jgi:uncharacterized protein with HEPN domain
MEKAAQFVHGMTFEQFVKDSKTVLWKTVHEDLPNLEPGIRRLLAEAEP